MFGIAISPLPINKVGSAFGQLSRTNVKSNMIYRLFSRKYRHLIDTPCLIKQQLLLEIFISIFIKLVVIFVVVNLATPIAI